MFEMTDQQRENRLLAKANIAAFGIDFEEVRSYLEIRTGLDLFFIDATIGIGRQINYVTFHSKPLHINEIGAMKFVIKEVRVDLDIYMNEEKGTFSIRPSFRYEHHSGGSNGCGFQFGLFGDKDYFQEEDTAR